jgi:hypothetical protein
MITGNHAIALTFHLTSTNIDKSSRIGQLTVRYWSGPADRYGLLIHGGRSSADIETADFTVTWWVIASQVR